MLQIAAEELGVPIEMVHTSETATDAIANAQATSASFSADLNGPAVMEACQKLRKRLDLIKGKCSTDPNYLSRAHFDTFRTEKKTHFDPFEV